MNWITVTGSLVGHPPAAVVICPWSAAAAKSLQSCPTLCNPMDFSLPGSSVHGILKARELEWGAIACRQISYHQSHQERPKNKVNMCSVSFEVYTYQSNQSGPFM